MDADSSSEADEVNDDNSVVTVEATEAKAKLYKLMQDSDKTAAAETLSTITDNCDNVFA